MSRWWTNWWHGLAIQSDLGVRECRRLASSGTNAHVVLEEAPAREAGRTREPSDVTLAEAATALLPIPLLVSGRDEAALHGQAARYADWLARHPDVDWEAVLRTAAFHRTHFAARASVSARDAAEAAEALRALGEGRSHAAVSVGEAKGERSGKLAFLFTGQGAQQLGMGRALVESCAAFRAAFEEACGHFDELLDTPLRVVLFAGGGLGGGGEVGRDGLCAACIVCG